MSDPVNLGNLIDQWMTLLSEKSDIEAALRDKKKEAELIQESIASNLDAIGLDLARGNLGSAFFSENETVALEDPQAFGDYVVETNQPFLYQARLAPKAVLEMIKLGSVIPGVKPITTRKLSYNRGGKQ